MKWSGNKAKNDIPINDYGASGRLDLTTQEPTSTAKPANNSSQVQSAVFETDGSGFITSWDHNSQELYGYDEAEIIGLHFSQLFAQRDLRQGKASLALRKAESRGWHFCETWQSRKNGQCFLSYFESTALFDSIGKACGFRNTIIEQCLDV